MRWSRRGRSTNSAPLTMTATARRRSFDSPSPSLIVGRYIAVESTADPTGGNADGNTEILLYKTRSRHWIQVTNTLAPVENHRPATIDGRRIRLRFERRSGQRSETSQQRRRQPRALPRPHARRRRARSRRSPTRVAPVVTTSAAASTRDNALVAFSSNGDFGGENADGNREYSDHQGVPSQVTHSIAGHCDELGDAACEQRQPAQSARTDA